MSNLPKISIVTPSFNQARFLEQTIRSVIEQDYPNLEYIVIDGGSSDNSVEIIRKYEQHLASWVSERDSGQADAIAKGFGMATGDILCWLNSDDVLYPGALQAVADCFAADAECGCVYGRAMYTTEDGAEVCEYPTGEFDFERLAVFNFICQPATFFRRSVYEAVGGVDRTLRFSMDYDLWIRMARVARFCYLPELLATYRLHLDSKTVSPAASTANHAEGLATTMRHFKWAPVSKVYGYCYLLTPEKLPKLLRVSVAAIRTIGRYLALNRGVNRKDLHLFTLANLRKFLTGWEDVTVTAGRRK